MPLPKELGEIFALIQQGRTGPARVRIVKHQKLHPDDGQSVFLFGLSYHREKKYGRARPYLEKAIEMLPEYGPSHYFLGWTTYYLGDLEASQRAFLTFLEASPNDADTHFGLGLVALDQHDLDNAKTRLERSLALLGHGEFTGRDRSKALTRLAEVALAREDASEARRRLEQAVDAFPENDEALYRLSRLLRQMGDISAADEALLRFRAAWERKQVHGQR